LKKQQNFINNFFKAEGVPKTKQKYKTITHEGAKNKTTQKTRATKNKTA